MDFRTDGRKDRRIDRYIDRRIDRRMDGWIDRQTDRYSGPGMLLHLCKQETIQRQRLDCWAVESSGFTVKTTNSDRVGPSGKPASVTF